LGGVRLSTPIPVSGLSTDANRDSDQHGRLLALGRVVRQRERPVEHDHLQRIRTSSSPSSLSLTADLNYLQMIKVGIAVGVLSWQTFNETYGRNFGGSVQNNLPSLDRRDTLATACTSSPLAPIPPHTYWGRLQLCRRSQRQHRDWELVLSRQLWRSPDSSVRHDHARPRTSHPEPLHDAVLDIPEDARPYRLQLPHLVSRVVSSPIVGTGR
jgi:hypothetical protein